MINKSEMTKISIIAEMAWSHDGSVSKAIKLLRAAKNSGANYFGIHITNLKTYMSKYYQNSPGKVSQGKENLDIYKYLDKINLTNENWILLKKTAKKIKMELCVMPNDIESLTFTKKYIKPEMYALSAASFNEKLMINRIAGTKKKVVIRTGGATLNKIKKIKKIFKKKKNNKFTLLHGIQVYPTSVGEINLNQLTTLKKKFKCSIGLADHIDGGNEFAIYLPALAVPLGVDVIEKHITLDRKEKSEDFEAALDPKNFEKMVRSIKLSIKSLGKKNFSGLSKSELRYRQVSRKRTVAKIKINKGDKISPKNIIFKRSDTGIDPLKIENYFGKKSKKEINEDLPILKRNLY